MTNETIDKFLGLNQRDRISVGELASTYNCSARRYPLLAGRKKRGFIGNIPINGCCVNDALYFSFSGFSEADFICKLGSTPTEHDAEWDSNMDFSANYICYKIVSAEFTDDDVTRSIPLSEISIHGYERNADDEACTIFRIGYTIPTSATVTVNGYYATQCAEIDKKSKHDLIPMGANICIFPDKKVFNTINNGTTAMERSITANGTATIQICDQQGEGINATIGTQPVSPTDGTYWIDSSSGVDILKRYSAIYGRFIEITTTFIAIKVNGIGSYFNQWDGVEVTESTDAEIDKSVVIYNKDTNWVIIPGTCKNRLTTATIKLERKVPDMDYVCECNNRLWGCKYGNGINEIYASALGDPKVWNRFLGISTDSYVASRGCPGAWTGCINYLDSPIFFKENYIEQIAVSSTGAHQISTVNINGIGVKNNKSLAIVDNVLYYMGNNGFYAYTGTLPKKISEKITDTFTSCIAGDLSGFYYACGTNGDTHTLYHYDADNQLWYKEDNLNVTYMARVGTELFLFTSNGVYTVNGSVGDQENLEWSAETGDFGMTSNVDKYPAEISIRASGDLGDHIDVKIAYDGSLEPKTLGDIQCIGGHRYFTYTMIPNRCDHFRIIFNGTGNSAVWGVIVKYADGGKTR